MYFPITLSAFILMSMMNVSDSDTEKEQEVQKMESASIMEKDKFKPKKMISIHPLRAKYTVKVGQQVYYSASVHGSVGYDASAYSTDDEILLYSDRVFEYDDEKQAEMSGGDSATKYFIFNAEKIGIANVVVKHFFRGELQNEYSIEITVTE